MPNAFPENPSILGHIFRREAGHLPDTLANRQLLLQLANDPLSKLGIDRYGTEWYAKMQPDGNQVWAQARGGLIFEGGLNRKPKAYDMRTGLKRP